MVAPKLSLIIVNYRSSDVLEHCLRSLHVATDAAVEVLVVNNSPEEDISSVVKASGYHGHVFSQTSNIGFAEGVNLAARHAAGDILCVVHPDVLFEAHSLDRLLTWVEQHPRTVAGPKHFDADGTVQTSIAPKHSRRTVWGPTFHRGSPWPKSLQPWMAWIDPSLRLSAVNTSVDEPMAVPVLYSSCLVMSRAVWEEVGGFDREAEYVALESNWFARAHELGVTAWLVPDAHVYHDRSTSVRRAQPWTVRKVTDENRRRQARRLGLIAVAVLLIVLWFERRLRPRDAA